MPLKCRITVWIARSSGRPGRRQWASTRSLRRVGPVDEEQRLPAARGGRRPPWRARRRPSEPPRSLPPPAWCGQLGVAADDDGRVPGCNEPGCHAKVARMIGDAGFGSRAPAGRRRGAAVEDGAILRGRPWRGLPVRLARCGAFFRLRTGRKQTKNQRGRHRPAGRGRAQCGRCGLQPHDGQVGTGPVFRLRAQHVEVVRHLESVALLVPLSSRSRASEAAPALAALSVAEPASTASAALTMGAVWRSSSTTFRPFFSWRAAWRGSDVGRAAKGRQDLAVERGFVGGQFRDRMDRHGVVVKRAAISAPRP